MNQLYKYKNILFGIFAFCFATVLAFLLTKNTQPTEAADLSNFKAGNIISDYTMSNYDSMSKDDIRNFLHRNASCDDYDLKKTNLGGYNWEYIESRDSSGVNYNYRIHFAFYSNGSTRYSYSDYHVENGHFVCLADESFNGQSAADIIYDVAYKYRINPQVLIVLLQKEQGLISDKFPNAIQYRSATGYGCPDTAACDSEYYGFRNQLENAAGLFRYVLDNGSYYKPVGNNYIQYNPDSGCGGSTVYIENRATAALYQYTPYQPNGPALNAGYGTGDYCSAYGNRNFYLYFSDWFGEPENSGYREMVSPRYMTNLDTGEITYFTIKRGDGSTLCLSSNETSQCVSYEKLVDTSWDWQPMVVPRYLKGKNNARIINLTGEATKGDVVGETIYYNKKTVLPDGEQCLLPESPEYEGWCAIFSTLTEATLEKQPMLFPRDMKVKDAPSAGSLIDPLTRKKISTLTPASTYFFKDKIYLPGIGNCLVMDTYDNGCILQDNLLETWMKMEFQRDMISVADTYKINPFTNKSNQDILIEAGMQRKFLSKIYYNNEWCVRTEYDDVLGNPNCILISQLREAWVDLPTTEYRQIKTGAQKINAIDLTLGLVVQDKTLRLFTSKYYINSKSSWCYKTEYDTIKKTDACFLESDIE